MIRDGDARGILIQTRNAIIENNTLENIYLSGILLSFEFAFYDGGPAPRDTIVRGNILREVAIGRQAQAGFGGITVLAKGKDRLKVVNSRELHSMVLESNSVAGTGNWGLVLTNVEGVAVTNLALSRTNSIRQIPPGTNIGPTPNSAIVVDDSRTVEFRCSNVADQGAFATGLVQFGPLAVPSSIDLTGLKRN